MVCISGCTSVSVFPSFILTRESRVCVCVHGVCVRVCMTWMAPDSMQRVGTRLSSSSAAVLPFYRVNVSSLHVCVVPDETQEDCTHTTSQTHLGSNYAKPNRDPSMK